VFCSDVLIQYNARCSAGFWHPHQHKIRSPSQFLTFKDIIYIITRMGERFNQLKRRAYETALTIGTPLTYFAAGELDRNGQRGLVAITLGVAAAEMSLLGFSVTHKINAAREKGRAEGYKSGYTLGKSEAATKA
jgi:hypothetical protein